MLERTTVEALFRRLTAAYGTRFAKAWDGVPRDAVLADWSERLDGVSHNAIEYAIANLPPDWPPTSMQFRALCIQRPMRSDVPMLKGTGAPMSPTVRARLQRAREAMATAGDGLKWARSLRARERNGERLTLAQREAWRHALRHEVIGVTT